MSTHLMGSTERRVACLRIAASMLRPRAKDVDPPTAEELIKYSAKLDNYAYRGEGHDQ